MSNSQVEAHFVAEARVIPRWIKEKGVTRCFVYSGRSMTPTFRGGSLLYVRPEACDVAVGDVIVFANSAGEHVVHRVVSITDSGLITHGDSNSCYDVDPVSHESVIGRVEMVEGKRDVVPVARGKRGIWSARIRRWRRQVTRSLRRILGAPYRLLYHFPVVHPVLTRFLLRRLVVLHCATSAGPVLKFIRDGKVIARWAPGRTSVTIESPYDLFIHPDDIIGQAAALGHSG
jgi:signal peptidase I